MRRQQGLGAIALTGGMVLLFAGLFISTIWQAVLVMLGGIALAAVGALLLCFEK